MSICGHGRWRTRQSTPPPPPPLPSCNLVKSETDPLNKYKSEVGGKFWETKKREETPTLQINGSHQMQTNMPYVFQSPKELHL